MYNSLTKRNCCIMQNVQWKCHIIPWFIKPYISLRVWDVLTIQAITESHILALVDIVRFIKIINKTSAAFRKMNTHHHLAFKDVKCFQLFLCNFQNVQGNWNLADSQTKEPIQRIKYIKLHEFKVEYNHWESNKNYGCIYVEFRPLL